MSWSAKSQPDMCLLYVTITSGLSTWFPNLFLQELHWHHELLTVNRPLFYHDVSDTISRPYIWKLIPPFSICSLLQLLEGLSCWHTLCHMQKCIWKEVHA